ncbi:hypothetical protein [Achromobacter insuavis]|uniref:Uncharacterized protein n=1 Tax=Achromobacter insuavis AXX-A TaxID=1003200 RepID=F7TAZ8_9BURK|nr:hypothetical protein [Achromobacter insuavis]EGP42514.1 hypothetical protein AXXA_30752 [Achromobacter insuavis AXX-A]
MHTRREPTLSPDNADAPLPPATSATPGLPRPSSALRTWTWLLYIGLWVLVVIFKPDGASSAPTTAESMGYRFGSAVGSAISLLLPAAVVILVMSLFKRFRTPLHRMRAAFATGLLLAVAAAALAGFSAYRETQKATALAEIRRTGEWMRAALNAPDHPPGDVPDIDATPKARGVYGEIERGVKLILGQRVAQYRAYMKELDEVRLSDLFIPNRLARDRGMVESRLILEQSQRVVRKYSQQNQRLLADVPITIRSLDLSDQQKDRMVEGAIKARPQQKATLARNWDLERQTLDEFEKMINLLDDNRRSWRVEHNEIVFDRDSLLNRFRAHQLAVRQLTEERARLESQQFDSLTSVLR